MKKQTSEERYEIMQFSLSDEPIENEQRQQPEKTPSEVQQIQKESDYQVTKHHLFVMTKKSLALSKYKLKFVELKQEIEPLKKENQQLRNQIMHWKSKHEILQQQHQKSQRKISQYEKSMKIESTRTSPPRENNEIKLKQQIRSLKEKVLQQRTQMHIILQQLNAQKQKVVKCEEQLLQYQVRESQTTQKNNI